MVPRHYPHRYSDPDPDPMIASPTFSYQGESTPPLPPYAPSYTHSSHPNSPTSPVNPFTQLHSQSQDLPTLTSPFPPPLPAPPNLQIRLRSQLSVLQDLDASLAQKFEEEGLPPILDESRMVAKGRVEVEEGEAELNAREARGALDEFARNRMPFVVLASQRLQAVLGEKNTLDFELPDVPLNYSPFLHRLAANSSSQPNNLSPGFTSRNNSNSNGGGSDRRKDSGVGLSFRSPLSPISPWGFGQVDEKTGKGLREWLLSRGKETGTQRKRECRSISFHDFIPDMRTGEQANELVAHYTGGGLHERADVYEVDLPTTYIDPTTNAPTQGSQTWIWFLISRPILTLSSTETNTDPYYEESWVKAGLWTPKPPSVIRPPPDFPVPIPNSYVVFACPASNVTAYPDCKDDSAPSDPSAPTPSSTSYIHTLAPSYRTSHVNSRTRPRAPSTADPDVAPSPSPPKKIYKRKDYDFSFQGTPIFEFSSLSSQHITVPNPKDPATTANTHDPNLNDHTFSILSIDNLGSWYPTDSSGPCTLTEYQTRLQAWEAEIENLSREERKEDDRMYRDRSTEVPHARVGKWWDLFYEEVYKEEGRWRRIRECMSRGKCRIVIRWVEAEQSTSPNAGGSGYGGARKKQKMSPNLSFSSDEAEGSGGDSDFSDGAGVGLGLDFNVGGQSGSGRTNGSGSGNNGVGNRNDGKKGKDRLSSRRTSGVAGQARVTRNGSRRKSGLGIVTTSQENLNEAMMAANVSGHAGVLIGIGKENGMGVDALIGDLKVGGGGAAGMVKDKRRKK